MENLKITINLGSPVVLNRFTTIDSILLNLALTRKYGKKRLSQEQLFAEDFLEKSKDGYTGSIWFVEKGEQIFLENRSYVKKSDYEYLNAHRAKPIAYNAGSGEFKLYNIWVETMGVSSVYFYARGDKAVIEDLLKDLKFLGKKSAIGYGTVTGFKVEVIKENKSLFLDKNTPSRPLSLKNFILDNGRIAYYAPRIPYWDNANQEACYMPNSSLEESLYVKPSNSKKADYKYLTDRVSACKFVYDVLAKDKAHWQEIDLKKYAQKADKVIDGEEKYLCAFTGVMRDEGILSDVIEKTLGDTFTDYAYHNGSKFISKEVFWTLQNGVNSRVGKLALGFHICTEKGLSYVMGKNKTQTLREAFMNSPLPFNVALKTTSNNQHVVFKSKLTLSNEMIACQYGGETFYFGISEVVACLDRVNELIKLYPITKSHLIQNPQIKGPFARLRKEAREVPGLVEAISEFFKTYPRDVRAGAFFLTVGVEKKEAK